MSKKHLILVLAIIFSFFLDGQLTTLLSAIFNHHLLVASHLLLIFIFYAAMLTERFWLVLAVFVLGLFYDSYYFLSIGLATYLLPVVVVGLQMSKPYWLKASWRRFLGLFCLILVVDSGFYGIAKLYDLTRFASSHYLTAQLLPTSVWTLILLTSSFKVLDQFFIEN